MKPFSLLSLFPGFLFSFILPVATGDTASGADLAGTRPNIILVMTDDQGLGDLSCMGNRVLRILNVYEIY